VLLAVFGLVWAPMIWPIFPGPLAVVLFLGLTLLLLSAAAWEWSRLTGWPGWRAWASGVLCVVLCLMTQIIYWLVGEIELIYLASMLWIVGGVWLLQRGVACWTALPRWLRWCIGMAMLMTVWLVFTSSLMLFGRRGVVFLLSVLALVWAADVVAYFCGRALGGKFTGGRKLAPAISPGKSWEGAVGGFIGVLLMGAIWVWVDHAYQLPPNLYTILWQRGPLWFIGALAILTAMSIVGDLTESLVKRAAGVKDSSQLLPGHGGVLDRIDALLPTLPLALALTIPALHRVGGVTP
jgi:phosphatidate cytidylyltransferase